MDEALRTESERLERSWLQHEAAWLRDYLVAGVEDPRINLQSILSRHFLLRAACGERLDWLMQHEYRFSAVMNWLMALAKRSSETEELASVRYALSQGTDNAEGIEIPAFVLQTFASLPEVGPDRSVRVRNYIETFLSGTQFQNGQPVLDQESLDCFAEVWRSALASPCFATDPQPISVLEPACGSANDYRFLRAYGLTRFLDYTGLDLCQVNIDNALRLFPQARFAPGNVFELPAADRTFELCFVHDLFEHLSPLGLARAVAEICRVTSRGICIGFFNMDEVPEHRINSVEEYHWNRLSLARMKELFATQSFECRAIHIGSFLRQEVGCNETHNANAYTCFLWRSSHAPS